jgi:hypothetical protein
MIICMRRISGSYGGREVFWTGANSEVNGSPMATVFVENAKMFTSYEDAYAAANEAGGMDWWNPRKMT